jgi:hypothetical protein
MMLLGRFEIGRLIVAALLGVYSVVLIFSRDAVMSSWLHAVGLAILSLPLHPNS